MNPLRAWLRRALSLSSRQAVAHAYRRGNDFKNGVRFSDARSDIDIGGYTLQVEIRQAVLGGALFENKLTNLTHGARAVNLSVIAPSQTWSFWRYVKQPSERNGFVMGRNLVNGQLTRQVGGGLCQLSSLIYHLSLLAGLTIAERHAHSFDIYQDHERYTPLGADATVVWGFKDLRLINPYEVNVLFECVVQDDFITGRVYAEGELPSHDVAFICERINERLVKVDTWVNKQRHTQTLYEKILS